MSVILFSLSLMTVFELTKQLLYPDITLWESHLATIIFSASTASLAAFFALKRLAKMNDLLMMENMERRKAEERLASYQKELEGTVERQTWELRSSNEALKEEIEDRKKIEGELRSSREQMRVFAAHLQAVREDERTRISREIHDEFGQSLTALKINLAWLRKRSSGNGTPPEVVEKIDSMTGLVDSTIHAVRRIASDLRPGVLDDQVLVAAMEWLLRDFSARTGIKAGFSTDLGETRFDTSYATAVFRILQEALTNVMRHAEASSVSVAFRKDGDRLTLEIRDNGDGIKEHEISANLSLGLLGIRERAELLGGSFTISGRPGEGTFVVVTLPFAGAEA